MSDFENEPHEDAEEPRELSEEELEDVAGGKGSIQYDAGQLGA